MYFIVLEDSDGDYVLLAGCEDGTANTLSVFGSKNRQDAVDLLNGFAESDPQTFSVYHQLKPRSLPHPDREPVF